MKLKSVFDLSCGPTWDEKTFVPGSPGKVITPKEKKKVNLKYYFWSYNFCVHGFFYIQGSMQSSVLKSNKRKKKPTHIGS